MIETYSPPNVLNFMQRLFQSNVSIELSDSGGAVYPILSNDEAILSGPFGDLHNANWGQDVPHLVHQRYS